MTEDDARRRVEREKTFYTCPGGFTARVVFLAGANLLTSPVSRGASAHS